MKALKSDLAKKLLSDPKEREKLRQVQATGKSSVGPIVEVRDGQEIKRYKPTVVAKAS